MHAQELDSQMKKGNVASCKKAACEQSGGWFISCGRWSAIVHIAPFLAVSDSTQMYQVWDITQLQEWCCNYSMAIYSVKIMTTHSPCMSSTVWFWCLTTTAGAPVEQSYIVAISYQYRHLIVHAWSMWRTWDYSPPPPILALDGLAQLLTSITLTFCA